MEVDEFMEQVGREIAGDALLQSWCQAEFGRPLLVLVGVDDRNPPQAGSYPLVAISDCDEAIDRGRRVYLLYFSVGVVNEAVVIEDNIRILPGLTQVVRLNEEVQKAIGRSKLVANPEFEGAEAVLKVFPEFVKYMAAKCGLVQSSRRPLHAPPIIEE